MPMKVLEFVNTLKQFVKEKLERTHSCHIIRVYYSSIINELNYDTYEVVPLQINIMTDTRDWCPIVISFDQIVEMFNGKIPYLRVSDTKDKSRRLYPKGCTYLQITNNLQNCNGHDWYPHRTYCTNQLPFDALDKEVTAKVKAIKAEYAKKIREEMEPYQELMNTDKLDASDFN